MIVIQALLSYGEYLEMLDYEILVTENSQRRAKSRDIRPGGLKPHLFFHYSESSSI